MAVGVEPLWQGWERSRSCGRPWSGGFLAVLMAIGRDPGSTGGADDDPAGAREFHEVPDSDPDAELLRAVIAEHPHGTRAFAALMERFWMRTWTQCQAILLNEADAEEATQDVFLKVHRYLPGFRFESRFSTWLHRIARNTAINVFQSRKREQAARKRAERDPVLGVFWLPWKDHGPGMTRLDLRAALDQLDPEERSILVVHEIEGLSYEEIAEDLEVSAGAVRMRAMRAREKLRKLMKPRPSLREVFSRRGKETA